MNYTKVSLQGSKEAVIEDIESLTYNNEQVYVMHKLDDEGEKVLLDVPRNYERRFGNFERFVMTPLRQIVLSPATYDEEGEEITPATLGDWTTHLVLPKGYDVSTLNCVVP